MFKLLTMLLTFVIGTSTVALSQAYYCYSESGASVNLTVQDSIVAVKLDGARMSWYGLFALEDALDPSIAPEPICEDFALLRVVPDCDPVALVARLRNLYGVLFANLSFLDAYGNPVYLTESFIANFHPGVSQAKIDSMNTAHGVVILDSLFNDPTWLLLQLTGNSDLDVLTMGNHYHESSLVNYAKAGMVLNLQLDTDVRDEYWWYQWHFENMGQLGSPSGPDIDLEMAFEFHQPDPSTIVIVAILDDGFAPHEDFPASRIVGGWDYAGSGPIGDSIYSPGPKRYHGMACMGIIGATTAEDWREPLVDGVAGVSDHVRILGQKIADDEARWLTNDAKIAKAFSDAVSAGARVISNSWSCADCGAGVGYESTTWWIRMADNAGVSVVSSSGNNGRKVGWPANMPEVLAVGATDSMDQYWDYSGYGPELDVVAPSSKLPSGQLVGSGTRGNFWTLDQMDTLGMNNGSLPCGLPGHPVWDPDYNCAFGGTSAAAPQVAGVIAMILTHRPTLIGQTATIRDIIRHSSEDRGSPGWDEHYGWGRLNAELAVYAVMRGDVNNDGSVNISDAIYLVNYIFASGVYPLPYLGVGDANCDGLINVSDPVRLIAYIFAGGSPPDICFDYDY